MPAVSDRQKKAKAVFKALLKSARQTWTAESSSRFDKNGNRVIYTQIREADGRLSCDCPGWINFTEAKQKGIGARWCRHLDIAKMKGDFYVRKDGTFHYAVDKD